MALIQCPECGKGVCPQALMCPHFGYPLSENDRIEKTYPKPKEESWINKYRRKKFFLY